MQRKWIKPPKDRPWARIHIDVIDSAAWRGLSINARRVLDALIAQHFRYWQKENGNLQISYRDFNNAGVTRRLIGAGIQELKDAGLITTRQGTPTNDVMRPPTLYDLTMYPQAGLPKKAPRRFVWLHVEVMESPHWCGLSINARRILDRLLIENNQHRSEKNGQLQVSFDQFVEHGVGRRFVRPALKELVSLGLLTISSGKAQGCRRPPNLYRLAFLGTLDGPATWTGYATRATEAAPKRASKSSRLKAAPVQRTIECPPAKDSPAPAHEGALEKKHFPPPKGEPTAPPEGALAPHPEGALAGPNRPPPEGALTSIFRSPRDHSAKAALGRRANDHAGASNHGAWLVHGRLEWRRDAPQPSKPLPECIRVKSPRPPDRKAMTKADQWKIVSA
jgi:hypothetical protein